MTANRIATLLCIGLLWGVVDCAPSPSGCQDIVIPPSKKSCLLNHLIQIISHLIDHQEQKDEPLDIPCMSPIDENRCPTIIVQLNPSACDSDTEEDSKKNPEPPNFTDDNHSTETSIKGYPNTKEDSNTYGNGDTGNIEEKEVVNKEGPYKNVDVVSKRISDDNIVPTIKKEETSTPVDVASENSEAVVNKEETKDADVIGADAIDPIKTEDTKQVDVSNEKIDAEKVVDKEKPPKDDDIIGKRISADDLDPTYREENSTHVDASSEKIDPVNKEELPKDFDIRNGEEIPEAPDTNEKEEAAEDPEGMGGVLDSKNKEDPPKGAIVSNKEIVVVSNEREEAPEEIDVVNKRIAEDEDPRNQVEAPKNVDVGNRKAILDIEVTFLRNLMKIAAAVKHTLNDINENEK